MKPLVIYHADCTDGFGAAFAAWMKLGYEAEYLPMQYGRVKSPADLPFINNRDVYILDFSFPRNVMDWLFANSKHVVWLDHHKTAFEMYAPCPMDEITFVVGQKETDHVHLHNGKSGTLLAWEYFHPDTEIPMLIRNIDDRDRWQFKLEGSREIHAALASYKPWSFEQWNVWLNYEYSTWDDLFQEGEAILRAQDAHVKSMVKQARKCELFQLKAGPYEFEDVFRERGLAVNTPMHMSEVGDELANQSGTYGLVWYVGNDNRAKCSLRSNGDYDVSAIAKSFGGGGHKTAAGFETDIDTLMKWLA